MSNSAQEAVRRYLDFIANPQSAIDQDAIAGAEAAIGEAEASGDRLAELEARAALAKAKQADGSELEAAFVGQARAYAQERDIPVAAFEDMGVPSDVLRRAGLLRGGAGGRRSSAPARSTRSKRVNVEAIQDHMRAMSKGSTFTIAELQDSLGGSPATTRKAIDLMPSSDVSEVTDTAVIAKHATGSRGRAPKVWQRV
jgi:hypothetical protein